MRFYHESTSLLHSADRTFEPVVGEGFDLAAAVTDEVVVVIVEHGTARLVPGDSVTDVYPLDEPLRCQGVDDPVDAREPGGLPRRVQGIVDLQSRDATALPAEQLDHESAGRTKPIAGRTKPLMSGVDPAICRRGHGEMITLLDKIHENRYRFDR